MKKMQNNNVFAHLIINFLVYISVLREDAVDVQ